MPTKLSVSIASASSEIAKDKILAVLHAPKGAAEVVRDSNGRVVSVLITLPTAAAAAAKAALEATPGVAGVALTEIPLGMVGVDGSTIVTTALASLGFSVFEYGPSAQSTDGDIATLTAPFDSALVSFTKNYALASNLLGSRVLIEMEAIQTTGFYRLNLDMFDGTQLMILDVTATDWSLATRGEAFGGALTAGKHKFDVNILPNAGGGTLRVDGILVATAAVSVPGYEAVPVLMLQLQGDTGAGFKLDNFSYIPAV